MDSEQTACVFCGDPDCYEHCSGAAHGKHAIDFDHWPIIAQGYDFVAEGCFVLDLYCKHCGQSGSVTISPDDVMW